MNPPPAFSCSSSSSLISYNPLHPSSHLLISSHLWALSSAMAATTTTTLSSFSSYYHLIFTVLAFAISTTIIVLSRKKSKTSPNLPPGPPGWPVVGNLFQVARSGKFFFQYTKALLPKYAPIFTLRMGTRTMIVVCSSELAHEALVKKGQIFATRPEETHTRNLFSHNKFTVNAASYGPVWRSLRRNMVQNALSATRLKEFRRIRNDGMDKLINRLREEAKENGGTVWVLKNVRFAFFCILLSMCFGLDMSDEMIKKIDQMMKKVLVTLNPPRIDDYLPILSVFFSKQRKMAREVRKEQIETLVPLIEQRRRVLQDPDSNPTAESFSYLDTLFDLEIEGKKAPLNHAEMVTLCSEFLNGGTDTTGTAVEWAIARIIDSPKTQEKLHAEIETVIGDQKRSVDESDLEKMPYLNAFTKELLRKHPPTPFALTHSATEATTLGGYDVPAGVSVEFYLPAISEDPGIWREPERFDPERFASGEEEVDITGVSGMKMLPFGAGRRICPGLSMATIHINLMIARMVQEFEWRNFPAEAKIDFSEKLEFTVVMKNTLRAAIKPRGGGGGLE